MTLSKNFFSHRVKKFNAAPRHPLPIPQPKYVVLLGEKCSVLLYLKKLSIYHCSSRIFKSWCDRCWLVFFKFLKPIHLCCFASSHFVKGDTLARSSRMNQTFSNRYGIEIHRHVRTNYVKTILININNWRYLGIKSKEIKDEFKEFWIYRLSGWIGMFSICDVKFLFSKYEPVQTNTKMKSITEIQKPSQIPEQ